MSYYEVDDDYPAIVLDSGSSTCRAGFAGDDAPMSVFPSIVGRRRHLLGNDKLYIGDEAQDKRELLSLNYPIEHGIVVNWDDMEKIWNHAFYSEMRISPQEHPILLSEPPLNPKSNREKMAQVIFESYGFPALFIGYQPMFSLFSSGMYQGVLVSVGHGITHVVPIHETQVQFQAARRLDFAGGDLTRYLQHLLYQRGLSFTTSAELEMVQEIKEQFCFVGIDDLDSRKSSDMAVEKCCTLKDGSNIKLDTECLRSPDILFQPDGVYSQGQGLADMIVDSLNDCSMEGRGELYNCVILSGGSTYLPGFSERLQNELILKSPQSEYVKVRAPSQRKYSEWIGGSIHASLSTFQCLWISKADYEEMGPTVVMFETYRFPAFCVTFEAILSLYSLGRLTGTMVNVGDGVTHVVPIVNGIAAHHAIGRSDFAGRDLNHHLQHLLYQRGYNFTTTADLDIVREIKEQKCFISANKLQPKHSLAVSNLEKSYRLPDGSIIKLDQEQYQCPEVLFNPHYMDCQNAVGLPELISNSINSCEIDCRKDLYSYVALSGGSTCFPGFKDRLQKDLEASTTKSLTSVRVAAAPERKYHLWIGGSLLASLTSFQRMWITQKDYSEYGPNILYLKSY